MFDVINNMALKSAELCTTKEDILKEEKRWKKYISLLNKFFAGKGECPYFNDLGEVEV